MKKSILSLLLAVVLTFGATQGMVSALTLAESDKDTPVAKIVNDDYKQFNDRATEEDIVKKNSEEAIASITECTEMFGGEVYTFESEEEYNRSVEKKSKTTSKSKTDSYVSSKAVEIKKTFKVLDKKTSKPISNAVVRLNGVPRYTDRNGEVKVTLTESVYELYIEKNIEGADKQYNPHMEFIYLQDEKDADSVKTVYLKHPSDDLEIYSANLRIGSAFSSSAEYYNLLEQEYHFALNYSDYLADIIIETNKEPEYSYLYVNGKLDRMTVGNDFYYFDYNKTKDNGEPWYEPGDKFSVSFVYEGIESEKYDLLLGFTDLDTAQAKIVAERTTENPEANLNGNDFGIFGNFSLNMADVVDSIQFWLRKSGSGLLKPIERAKWSGSFAPVFTATYKPRSNTIELVVGFEFEYSKSHSSSSAQELKEYQDAVANSKNAKKEYDKKRDELSTSEEQLKTAQSDKEKYEQRQHYYDMAGAYLASGRYEGYEERIRNYEKNFGEEFQDTTEQLKEATQHVNDLQSSVDYLKDSIKGLKPLAGKMLKPGTGLINSKIGFKIHAEIFGTFEISLNPKTEEETYENNPLHIIGCKITGSIKVSIAYNWQFIVVHVPVYVRVEGSLKVEITLTIKNSENGEFISAVDIETFLSFIVLNIELAFRGDLGIGFYDALSIGGFAEFKLEFNLNLGEMNKLDTGKITSEELKESYGKFVFSFGLRIKILFFEYQFRYPDDVGAAKLESYIFGHNNTDKTKIQTRAFLNNTKYMDNNDYIINSAYQNGKPQIVNLGNNKFLLVWLQDSANRDALNRTELMYTLYDDGEWGEIRSVTQDSGFADFYPQLYKSGENIYLAWQRNNSKLTETDSIIDMTSKSEIWFAEFDTKNENFNNVNRITNNSEMDLAPKFVVSDKSDSISLIWQNNTKNDILGLNGVNNIVHSSYKNGQWAQPEILYSTENLISYITGAEVNGKLNLAFVEDTDKDVMTSEDRVIKVIEDGSVTYSVLEEVGNTQFVLNNGNISLYYLQNKNIVKTNNFVTSETILTSDSGEFNFGFNVVSDDNGTVIFYDTTNGEHKQSYCAVYDSVSNEWLRKVKLSDCNDNAIAGIGFINNNGTISFVHIMTDDEETYGSICYGEKELKYDFDIIDVGFNGNLADEKKFTLTVALKNTGDYDLDYFCFEIFGQTKEVVLESSLSNGSVIYVSIDFVAMIMKGQESANLTVKTICRDHVMAQAEYEVFFGYSDVAIQAEILLKSNVQHILISLENISMFDSIGYLNIYINGVLVDKYDEIAIDSGNNEIIDFALQDVNLNDSIYVQFVSYKAEKNITNNSLIMKSIADSVKAEVLKLNPYDNILSLAKRI